MEADPGTVSNIISVTNILIVLAIAVIGAGFTMVGYFLKMGFGWIKELHERSTADDKKIEDKVNETAGRTREVDRDLYKQDLQLFILLGEIKGEREGFRQGLAEAREQARVIREMQKP